VEIGRPSRPPAWMPAFLHPLASSLGPRTQRYEFTGAAAGRQGRARYEMRAAAGR
jgi:hypothetical protein